MAHDDWVKVGMAIHAKAPDAGFAIWDAWSAKGQKYPGEAELRRRWASFKPDAGVTFGTLFHMAGTTA